VEKDNNITDAAQQCEMGRRYFDGKDGAEQDFEQAVFWFEKAAAQGFAEGQFRLGICYINGNSVEPDMEKAVDLLTKAAEQSYADAQFLLGTIYDTGEYGLEQDKEKAAYWYAKSAEQGDNIAQFCLGVYYDNGEGVIQDKEKAVYWYTKSAEQGNDAAQYYLGVCYYYGSGVDTNYKQAAFWFKKSAEQDYEDAWEQLREHEELQYFFMDVERNKSDTFLQAYMKIFDKAVFMSKLSRQSGLLALENLIDKDKIKEALAVRPPITANSPQLDIKDVFEAGLQLIVDGTDKEIVEKQLTGIIDNEKDEEEKLLKTIEKTAILELQNGESTASLRLALHSYLEKKIGNIDEKSITDPAKQLEIGHYYYNLEGTDQHYEKAVLWYKKAADQGNAIAQNNLGECYENGKGLPKDIQQAVYWYKKAVEQDDAYAQFNLGQCYENGSGVEQDLKQAVDLYTKAAEQYHSTAQRNLAKCYEEGKGVESDMEVAVYWCMKAAVSGDPAAQVSMAGYYMEGKYVEQSEEEAIEWLVKAGWQDFPPAQYLLALHFKSIYDNIECDESDIADLEAAVNWANSALKHNIPEYADELKALIKDAEVDLKEYYCGNFEESD
jgi:TPR repeat protein